MKLTWAKDYHMKLRFDRVVLNSGDTIRFSPGITAIVGPNNVGKSRILADLGGWEGHNPPSESILSEIHLDYEKNVETVLSWCERHWAQPDKPGYESGFFTSNRERGFIPEQQIRYMWTGGDSVNPQFWSLYLPVDQRGELTKAQSTFHRLTERPQFALQRLWADRGLEQRLSNLVRRAFGSPATVLHEGGPRTSLYLGDPGVPPYPDTEEYLQRMATLPEVQMQGHGLRSFVGMLLEIMAGTQRILLIDEPEMFLHPPQARLLGRMLSQFRQQGMQIILCTHSTDILQGLVAGQAKPGSLTIIRLTRSDDENFASQIDPDTISRISSDPLLRHSSILDGLFYHGALLCEADGDATFYSAVNAHIATSSEHVTPVLDLLFTHTNGGYSRYSIAVRALRSAGVPVVSIVDMDVLGNGATLEALVAAHGNSLHELGIAGDLRRLVGVVNQKAVALLRKDIRRDLQPILAKTDRYIDGKELDVMRKAIRPATGWDDVKRSGQNYFRGEDYQAMQRVLSGLRQVGIFTVPVGELESFDPSVSPSPKASWLSAVLSARFDEQPGEHRDFVTDIRRFIADHQDASSVRTQANSGENGQ